jgi:hypothetical protein
MITARKSAKGLQPGDVITFGGAYDFPVGALPIRAKPTDRRIRT